MKRFLTLILLASAPVSVLAQNSNGSGSITSTQCVTIDPSLKGTIGISVTGTWTGTLQAQSSLGGDVVNSVSVYPASSAGGLTQPTITTNGLYFVPVYGTNFFQVCGASVASGTASVKLALSPYAFTPAMLSVIGQTTVTQDPTQVLFEDFGQALSTTKWNATAGGTGVAPSASVDAAGATLNGGTTTNSFSALSSVPQYEPTEPGFVRIQWRTQLLSNVSTTTYNFWGLANLPASSTIANPVVDGCGFDVLQGTTKLMAVCYQGTSGTTGARVVIQDLSSATGNATQPSDLTAVHKYDLLFSGALSYWFIDSKLVASMLTGANGPNFNTLSATALSVSNSGTANTQSLAAVSVGDTSKKEFNLCDPLNEWLCQKLATAATLTATINTTAALTEKGPRWTVSSAPAASAQATASKSAGATGVRHVADCVTISAGAATAPTATVLTINLRDGATGAGTVIWTTQITAGATATQHGNLSVCGLNLIGTAATAMTLEFGALLTSENEVVTLTGYDVQ